RRAREQVIRGGGATEGDPGHRDRLARADERRVEGGRPGAGDNIGAGDTRQRARRRRRRGPVIHLVRRRHRRRQRPRGDVPGRRRGRDRERIVGRRRATQRDTGDRHGLARADARGVERRRAGAGDDLGTDDGGQRAGRGRRRRPVVDPVGRRHRRRQRQRGDVRRRRRGGAREGVVAGRRTTQRDTRNRDGLARADERRVKRRRAGAGDDIGADDAGERAGRGGRRGPVVRLVRGRDRRRQ